MCFFFFFVFFFFLNLKPFPLNFNLPFVNVSSFIPMSQRIKLLCSREDYFNTKCFFVVVISFFSRLFCFYLTLECLKKLLRNPYLNFKYTKYGFRIIFFSF